MKVHINEPCNENWGQMTPKEQGRHCDKCEKVVVDFTQLSDAEVIQYLHANKNTCGRFNNWQLEKELTLPKLQNPWTNWISKFAWSSFLFGTSITAKSQSEQDSITPADSIETVSPIIYSLDSSKSVLGHIIQPEDSSLHCISLRFSIDSTVMTVFVADNSFAFQVPDSLSMQNLNVEIKTKSDTTVLQLTDSSFDHNNLVFLYENGWKLKTHNNEDSLSSIDLNKPEEFTVTLGDTWVEIVTSGFATTGVIMVDQPSGNFEPFPNDEIPCEGSKTLDIPNISGIKPPKSSDTNHQQLNESNKLSKELVVYKKRNSSVWWWLLPIPLILLISGYYIKKRAKTVDNETD